MVKHSANQINTDHATSNSIILPKISTSTINGKQAQKDMQKFKSPYRDPPRMKNQQKAALIGGQLAVRLDGAQKTQQYGSVLASNLDNNTIEKVNKTPQPDSHVKAES